MSISAIAREIGGDRKTVRKWLSEGTPAEEARAAPV